METISDSFVLIIYFLNRAEILIKKRIRAFNYFFSYFKLKGFPSFNTFLGILSFHFSRKALSSLASRRSSGNMWGIVSITGYHLPHLSQSITPSSTSALYNSQFNRCISKLSSGVRLEGSLPFFISRAFLSTVLTGHRLNPQLSLICPIFRRMFPDILGGGLVP